MKVTIEKDELVIRIPLQEPQKSASGKTMVVASTRGNQKTGCIHPKLKQPITIGVNAYCKGSDAAE